MNEFRLMQTMLSSAAESGGIGWLRVAMLLCLFAVFIFASDRIRNHTIYRWSCTIFALSVILPPFVQMLFGMWGQGMMSGRGNSGFEWMMYLPQVTSPLLLGISIILAFIALAPEPVVRPTEPSRKAHPLD